MDMVIQWCLNDALMVLEGPKCANNISSAPLHHYNQPEPLIPDRMNICMFLSFKPNSDLIIRILQQKSKIQKSKTTKVKKKRR